MIDISPAALETMHSEKKESYSVGDMQLEKDIGCVAVDRLTRNLDPAPR
jgi:hypothetical protein